MMGKEFQELAKRQKLKAIKLENTKRCIEMWREARSTNKDPMVIAELWKLAEVVARKDWGEGTVLDDFSVEGMVVVSNGIKRIEL